MAAIVPFLSTKDGNFDETATASMSKAFDLAIAGLHDKGQPNIVKEVIAKRIIELARYGELDPARLCEAALESLGLWRK